MAVTDAQVKKMRKELEKNGNLGRAAMKAGIDRKTARTYRDRGDLPSEAALGARDWRTRPDPFEAEWLEIEAKLRAAPSLEAKTLFDDLRERKPGVFAPGQLRTAQRQLFLPMATTRIPHRGFSFSRSRSSAVLLPSRPPGLQ